MTDEEFLDEMFSDPTEAFVYVVQIGEDGPIKIGFTTKIKRRIAAIRAGIPSRVFVRMIGPGTDRLEKMFHEMLEPHRLKGEWFVPTKEVMSLLASSLIQLDVSRFNDKKQRLKLGGEIRGKQLAANSTKNYWKTHPELERFRAMWKSREYPNSEIAKNAVNMEAERCKYKPPGSISNMNRAFGDRGIRRVKVKRKG